MHYPLLPLLAAGVLLLGGCTPEPAQILYCGTPSVTEGDSSFDLTQRCGQPTAVEQAQGRPIATPVYDMNLGHYVIQSRPQPYEVWVYNDGPDRPVARISIKNGTIARIEVTGAGK